MKKKLLSVRMNGEPIGILEQTLIGKMEFTYLASATKQVSISMPIQEEPYDDLTCEAFFGGLLPESDHVKKAIADKYRINYKNTFSLLKAIGHDCAGAISFHEMDEPIHTQSFFPLKGKIISENDLYEKIKALPKKPFFMDVKKLRLSLAGAHDKAAVCVIDNTVALPEEGCPTTHILKPAIEGYEDTVENEYFCLHLASQIGLTIPNIELRRIRDISYLLIERYDRRIQNNQVMRLHQEDFCQALRIPSIKKYQRDGGPGFKDSFHLLKNVMHPAIDRNKLAAALVFNFLIGNMDAHAKNFSLLYDFASQPVLSPFYDLLCTLVYKNLSSKMAMKVGGQYEVDYVLSRNFEKLCVDIDYSFPGLKKLIKNQSEVILTMIESEKHFYPIAPIVKKIIEVIQKRISKTLKLFEEN